MSKLLSSLWNTRGTAGRTFTLWCGCEVTCALGLAVPWANRGFDGTDTPG
jgi:hypothetical protein